MKQPAKYIPSSPLGERRGGLQGERRGGLFGLLMVAFAIVISTVALLLPPQGVIDPSVLWVVAQALLFAASVLGIDSCLQHLTRERPHFDQ